MSSPHPQLENFKYRPDVDGLRALAVIPVVLYHAALGFPGGFVGVDIFFVISGYLITSIIMKEMIQGIFSMKAFWARRIKRILPAATVMVLFTLLAGALILLPYQFQDLGKASVAQTFMVSNFYFWQQDGYFAAPSDFEPLLHTWSLSVEEQFYFFFPLLSLFLWRKFPRKLLPLILVIIMASLACSILTITPFPGATFYLLPSRAWELLVGALIAITPLKISSASFRETFSWIGLALITYSVFAYSAATHFPGLSAIPPVLGAALLILSNRDALTSVGKGLSSHPFVFVGKLSYSLYLWHWPLLIFGKHLSIHETPNSVRIVLVLASFLFAYLSWKFIETPFRNKNRLPSHKSAFKFFLGTTAGITLIGTAIYQLDGIPSRFSAQAQRIASVATEDRLVKDTRQVVKTKILPLLGPPSAEKTTLPVLFWGDSHNKMIMPIIRELCNEHKVDVYYSCRAEHPPLLNTNRFPDCENLAEFNDAVLTFIQNQKIKNVILSARWTKYCVQDPDSTDVALTDRLGTKEPPEIVFERALLETLQILHDLDIRVWIIPQVPYQKRNPIDLLFHAHRLGRDRDNLGVTIVEAQSHHQVANDIFDRTPAPLATFLNPLPLFSNKNDHTKIHIDGDSLYRDEDHLSNRGALYMKPIFAEIFEKISPR
ncbi:MAG: acyltransferase family protein [Akkermansiaceae bacterium]